MSFDGVLFDVCRGAATLGIPDLESPEFAVVDRMTCVFLSKADCMGPFFFNEPMLPFGTPIRPGFSHSQATADDESAQKLVVHTRGSECCGMSGLCAHLLDLTQKGTESGSCKAHANIYIHIYTYMYIHIYCRSWCLVASPLAGASQKLVH